MEDNKYNTYENTFIPLLKSTLKTVVFWYLQDNSQDKHIIYP